MEDIELRRLNARVDVSEFDCGERALNEYLKRFALESQAAHFAVTHVALQAASVVGFVTLAASQIARSEVGGGGSQKPRYPLPTLTLARLGVDQRWQHRGVGRMLLRFALREAIRMADEFGCVGIRLAAKPDAIGFYERFGFVALAPAREGVTQLAQATVPMFLPLNQIQDALNRSAD
jgi:GNAT superfamily N-acetyltransferase